MNSDCAGTLTQDPCAACISLVPAAPVPHLKVHVSQAGAARESDFHQRLVYLSNPLGMDATSLVENGWITGWITGWTTGWTRLAWWITGRGLPTGMEGAPELGPEAVGR